MRDVNSLAEELKGVFGWHQARVVLLAQLMMALVKVSQQILWVSRSIRSILQ